MKKPLIPLIVILAISALIQGNPASASTPLREDLKMFVANGSAVVSAAVGGGGLTLPGLNDESLLGVNGYRLIASYVVNWLPEFYILGEEGYRVLPISPVPKEGLTLIVNAVDRKVADSAAQMIGRAIKAAFTPTKEEASTYTYYSHIDFKIVTKTLLSTLPELEDGFTNLLKTTYGKKNLQIITLDAQRTQTAFTKQLTLLYAQPANRTNPFELNSILPGFSNVTASKEVDETSVEVVFADALISQDTLLSHGSITNFPTNVSSKVSFILEKGERAPFSKIDLIQSPPLIKAERLADKGVVEAVEGKDTVEVTVRIQNVAPVGSLAAEGLTLDEVWWRDKFELVSGRTSQANVTLKAGEEMEMQYVIRVKERTPTEIFVKGASTPITYTYRVGSDVWSGKAYPNDLRLILNKPRPTIIVAAEAHNPTPLQAGNTLRLEVNNLGARSADNVTVILEDITVAYKPILRALESWTLEVPVKPSRLTQPLREIRALVTWVDEEGVKTVSSNTASVMFSRSTLGAPKVNITQSASISPGEEGFTLKGAVTAYVTTVNETSLKVSTNLVEGFELVGGDFTPSDGVIKASSKVERGENKQTFEYIVRASRQISFVQPPALAEVEWDGFTLRTLSNSYAYAEGVKVIRSASRTVGFSGSTSSIKATIANLGPFPVYDVKVRTLNHSYAKAPYLEREAEVLDVGEEITFEFNARYTTSGVYEYVPIEGSYIFSGHNNSLKVEPIKVSVEKPIKLSLQATGALVEKQKTTLTFAVTNPSTLAAADIDIHIVFIGVDSPQSPVEIRIAELKGGEAVDREVQIVPSSVFTLQVSSTVSFSFSGETLRGEALNAKLPVSENLQMRYALPVALGVALVVATAYVSRRFSKEGLSSS